MHGCIPWILLIFHTWGLRKYGAIHECRTRTTCDWEVQRRHFGGQWLACTGCAMGVEPLVTSWIHMNSSLILRFWQAQTRGWADKPTSALTMVYCSQTTVYCEAWRSASVLFRVFLWKTDALPCPTQPEMAVSKPRIATLQLQNKMVRLRNKKMEIWWNDSRWLIGFIELAVQRIALTTSKQVSSIQTPGCLVYKGDCTTQLCRDYIKPFSRSLYINQSALDAFVT